MGKKQHLIGSFFDRVFRRRSSSDTEHNSVEAVTNRIKNSDLSNIRGVTKIGELPFTVNEPGIAAARRDSSVNVEEFATEITKSIDQQVTDTDTHMSRFLDAAGDIHDNLAGRVSPSTLNDLLSSARPRVTSLPEDSVVTGSPRTVALGTGDSGLKSQYSYEEHALIGEQRALEKFKAYMMKRPKREIMDGNPGQTQIYVDRYFLQEWLDVRLEEIEHHFNKKEAKNGQSA